MLFFSIIIRANPPNPRPVSLARLYPFLQERKFLILLNLPGLANKEVVFFQHHLFHDTGKTQTKCDFISLLFALSISKMDKGELRFFRFSTFLNRHNPNPNNINNLLIFSGIVKCVSSKLNPRLFKHPNIVSICHLTLYSSIAYLLCSLLATIKYSVFPSF
jgi:hypothetical protein